MGQFRSYLKASLSRVEKGEKNNCAKGFGRKLRPLISTIKKKRGGRERENMRNKNMRNSFLGKERMENSACNLLGNVMAAARGGKWFRFCRES